MKTPKKSLRFIILIPHRDVLMQIEAYRQKLFSRGFYGAHSFPLCAPLAVVSWPFSREELKELAHNIRKLSMYNDGKILSSESGTVSCPVFSASFFGPCLNLNTGEILSQQTDKLLFTLSPPVLCASLVEGGTKDKVEETPSLSFRAASVANLTIRPLFTAHSFEWKISPPVWLPGYKVN